MALLAFHAELFASEETLPDSLDRHVFDSLKSLVEDPAEADMRGFDAFIERHARALPLEAAFGNS